MPGIGELIDGAVQQAPQSGRQFIAAMLSRPSAMAMCVTAFGIHNEKHSQWSFG
jgi:hypothetical protein